jgi:rubrerythrin
MNGAHKSESGKGIPSLWWALLPVSLGFFSYVGYRVYRALFQNFGPLRGNLKKRDVENFLQWGLTVEREQVAFYNHYGDAAEKADLAHIAAAMRRFAVVEQEHADRITEELRHLGAKPARWTDMGPAIGVVSAAIHEIFEPSVVMKSAVAVEEKALDHYLREYKQSTDPRLRELCLNHMVDEECHAAWAHEAMVQWQNPEEKDSM